MAITASSGLQLPLLNLPNQQSSKNLSFLRKVYQTYFFHTHRNMATMAGNLVNASPIGDMTIFFLALNAEIVLSNGKSEKNYFS